MGGVLASSPLVSDLAGTWAAPAETTGMLNGRLRKLKGRRSYRVRRLPEPQPAPCRPVPALFTLELLLPSQPAA